MEDELLTTAEAARLLGVGPTSVKRWADAGLLNCVKTAGGHRRIPKRAVDRLLERQSKAGAVVIESMPSEPLRPELQNWVDTLTRDRTGGHDVEGRLLQERARLGSWWRVATVLGEVLFQVGQLWATGRLTVMREHLASERLARGLARCAEQLPSAPQSPICLLIATEGDEHTLGLSLFEIVAREAGWNTLWAGRSTPIEETERHLEAGTVSLVAVSGSSFSNDPMTLHNQAERLGNACRAHGVALVLGGSARWPDPPPFGVRLASFEEFYQRYRRA